MTRKARVPISSLPPAWSPGVAETRPVTEHCLGLRSVGLLVDRAQGESAIAACAARYVGYGMTRNKFDGGGGPEERSVRSETTLRARRKGLCCPLPPLAKFLRRRPRGQMGGKHPPTPYESAWMTSPRPSSLSFALLHMRPSTASESASGQVT